VKEPTDIFITESIIFHLHIILAVKEINMKIHIPLKMEDFFYYHSFIYHNKQCNKQLILKWKSYNKAKAVERVQSKRINIKLTIPRQP
jgi:hypothetical protein